MRRVDFSFHQFAILLSRVLEASAITALITKSVAFSVWWNTRSNSYLGPASHQLARTVLDDATSFFLLSILLLFATDVALLFFQRRSAAFALLRAFVYVLLFCTGRFPLGEQPHERPNHAMERTATRRALTFCVATTSSSRATRALGDLRSSCSR
jgi:hypothetical protein